METNLINAYKSLALVTKSAEYASLTNPQREALSQMITSIRNFLVIIAHRKAEASLDAVLDS